VATYTRPPLATIITRVIGDIRSRMQNAPLLRRSVERILGFAVAGTAHSVHGHLDSLRKQLLPTTSDIDGVREWGEMLGVPQGAGSYSAGRVRFDYVGGSGSLPRATILKSAAGTLYVVTNVETGGYAYSILEVRALEVGAASELAEGDELQLTSERAGYTVGVVESGGITGGTDAEDDEAYRTRVLERFAQPPHGGGPGDYRRWALEVAGVTRAWERANRVRLGTVSLAFVMDDRDNIIPLQDDVDTVLAYLAARQPIDLSDLYVSAPIAQPVTMTITLSPNTPDVQTAVLAELDTLFAEVEFESPLALSVIDEAISRAAGETSHVITTIAALTPAPWAILTRGDVTFGGA
jgi:uncharacterized phage protein gp47/JayE